jgi:hypothetical protein
LKIRVGHLVLRQGQPGEQQAKGKGKGFHVFG